MTPHKKIKLVRAISNIILVFYPFFLAFEIWNEWPHSTGWAIAAVWFFLYQIMERQYQGLIDSYQKLVDSIMDSWESAEKRAMAAIEKEIEANKTHATKTDK